MSLPRMAEVLVNWVPASCMPSPESPHRRIVASSISCSCACLAPRMGCSTVFDAVMGNVTSSMKCGGTRARGRGPVAVAFLPFVLRTLPFFSCSLGRLRHDGGVGGLVTDGGRVMLAQVMHD